ncbi:hypothetical protein SLEP1_g49906 [Rubroshorea leprosula]|uniref:F-box domain-containing protein n=1 Tax=Rubroshorea leprosula TaxID=152421 RepID=A0AAV5LYL0_9ROSI|nr:hypothetical protein SLEP1_g49906 [Rubroshorea leprosula]
MAGGAARISNSKHQKHDGDEDVYDRISALPNVLRTHILSFLPTKEAVRTCVLSKRWKFAWTSISELEFIEAGVSGTNRRINEQGFEKYVDGVLGRHDALFINKFILQCWCRDFHHQHLPLHVSKWISTAIALNVEELDILVRGLEPVALPPCLYTCGRLKVLKLCGILSLQVPELVCLNGLKILWLQGIMFLEDNSLRKLLSGSQFLDELLVRTTPWNSRSLGISSLSYISSPSLKILKIQDCLGYPETMDHSIVVDAPNMTDLHISIEDARRKCYTVKNSPNLVSAHIEINPSPSADVFVKLLENISHISRLNLLGLTKDLLEVDHYQNVPVFHNLKHLTIEILEGGWQ